MSTGRRARMATMQMRMRRKTRYKPMMDQHRMWRTEGIVRLTWESIISTDMRARMAMMRMRRMKHRKPMMDQRSL
jgi:hypothetical protein